MTAGRDGSSDRGTDTRQEYVESLSTLRLGGSPTQSRISPRIQRMLK